MDINLLVCVLSTLCIETAEQQELSDNKSVRTIRANSGELLYTIKTNIFIITFIYVEQDHIHLASGLCAIFCKNVDIVMNNFL